MKKYLQTLERCGLFLGLTGEEIICALGCLGAQIKCFSKDSTILSEGDYTGFIGIVLSGGIDVQKTDYAGNANIISKLFASDIIGAAAAFSGDKRMPFDVIATSDCEVLHLDSKKLLRQCSNACAFHSKILENILGIIAGKNILLSEKIDILTKRTIREKLLAFLYMQSKRTDKKKFAINMTRRQLADYLSVNRSAMIRELSSMRCDGLIGFEDNIFWLE